jgi:hypothetical protein
MRMILPARALRPWLAAALLAGAALLVGAALAQRYVESEHPDFPRIKYADSLVSVTARCVVKQSKLNLKVRPVYVNWRPIGFC